LVCVGMHDGRKEKRRKMSAYGNHVQNICVFSSLSLELSLQRSFVGSAKALQFGLFRLLLSSSSLSLFLSLSLSFRILHMPKREQILFILWVRLRQQKTYGLPEFSLVMQRVGGSIYENLKTLYSFCMKVRIKQIAEMPESHLSPLSSLEETDSTQIFSIASIWAAFDILYSSLNHSIEYL
jgi:hypothetical protein